VLASWPGLRTLDQAWLAVALAAEVASFTCTFALQRLALQTRQWFSVVTAGLSVNSGDALLATLAYRLASYWLPLCAGPPAYLLYRHRYGRWHQARD
jgi:hypothetical protein